MNRFASRQLGSAFRIYRNSSDKVIAVDEVNISADINRVGAETFHISVSNIDVSRTILHLTTGGSRVISSIQSIGDYSSIQENSGNFLIAQWNADNSGENDVVISFDGKVAKIGDSL